MAKKSTSKGGTLELFTSEHREHISFAREPDLEAERRRQKGRPGAVRPPPANHGESLGQAFTEAAEQTELSRLALGIDPSRLVVLELASLDPRKVRKLLESRFGAVVVDEHLSVDGKLVHFVVQFPSTEQQEAFHRALTRYRNGETGDADGLTEAQRRDLFVALESIRCIKAEDRKGPRLRERGWPDQESFFLDLDLWHPGTGEDALFVLDQVRQMCGSRGGFLSENTRTPSLLLAKVKANQALGEALLTLDLVARVDLPPVIRESSLRVIRQEVPNVVLPLPSGSEGVACSIDSGVLPGHPLLQGWVIEERDFDSGENTATDLHGHGTQVAGLIIHGDLDGALRKGRIQPHVRLCSAKVLRRDRKAIELGFEPDAVFPDELRIEKVTEDVIRYFHAERGCRIFNLSIGSTEPYSGGRQFPWAEKLDQLIRELDIIVVVPTGNRADPPIPLAGPLREDFQRAVLQQALDAPEHRICNPSTSALALTIGAIARTDACHSKDACAAAPAWGPSPFSRIGPGYELGGKKRVVKPDFAHPGGNYALQTMNGTSRWVTRDPSLGEPTTCLPEDGRILAAAIGTSFAGPPVACIAARIEAALQSQLGQPASANLIKAVMGVTTDRPPAPDGWFVDAKNPESEEKLRLVGYGLCDDERGLASSDRDVVLFSEDSLPEDCFHVYRIPLPQSFQQTRGKHMLTVSLAFDPPVRASRQGYLSRTMWSELFKGLSAKDIEQFRRRYEKEKQPPVLPDNSMIDLRPTRKAVQWSTLQVRRKVWQRCTELPVIEGEQGSALQLLIGCRIRFPSGEEPTQRYAIAVRLWHEGDPIVLKLHEQIKATVRIKQTVRVRV